MCQEIALLVFSLALRGAPRSSGASTLKVIQQANLSIIPVSVTMDFKHLEWKRRTPRYGV